ncbi:MAG TPA: hypothetical protein VLJ39_20565 [Tepidisphaeraceae bacterium]|nr:hypothetical protein [Tepidisphaeraceae bacterium]
MRFGRAQLLYVAIGAAWAGVVVFGVLRLWSYELTPAAPAHPPVNWPAESHVTRAPGLPTLVLLMHPRCPCSSATVAELAKVMTDCRGKLSATVLMMRPKGVPQGWEKTDLWQSSSVLSGVEVRADEGGIESRRFGAVTSGQALLYSADGRLLFAGGITASRGHRGDNAGRSAITSMVLDGGASLRATTGTASTPVYGCALVGKYDAQPTEGNPPCHNH